jgi:hypothetical protein
LRSCSDAGFAIRRLHRYNSPSRGITQLGTLAWHARSAVRQHLHTRIQVPASPLRPEAQDITLCGGALIRRGRQSNQRVSRLRAAFRSGAKRCLGLKPALHRARQSAHTLASGGFG